MKTALQRVLIGCAALAAMWCGGGMASGQAVSPGPGIVTFHSPYNDALSRVYWDAIKAFASPEDRKANAAELLQALDKLTPMVQRAIDQPGSEMTGTMATAMVKQLQANPAQAQELKEMHAQQLRVYSVLRLALNEPNAIKTYQAQVAKGGAIAAQAEVDRAAADWLMAAYDAKSQSDAFDRLHVTMDASGSGAPAKLACTILQYRHPDTAPLASAILEYLRPHADKIECRSMLMQLQHQVQAALLEGAALTLEGTLATTGKHFSTAQWKGKVVLVHVYGTECQGSDQEVAQMQRLAAAHPGGLEVLEVAHAPTLEALKQFLAAHRGFTAPEIYRGPLQRRQLDPAGSKPDPTREVGLLLIDRKGVTHVMGQAGDGLNADIAKYLAEKP